VCEIFTAVVVSELQRGPHVVLQNLYATNRHTYYIGAVCLLFFLNTYKKNICNSYEKRRPCVLSNISIVAISVGLPVAVNPVPASQVGFHQFRAI